MKCKCMNAGALIIALFNVLYSSSASDQLHSYGHWQCSLPHHKSLYEVVSAYVQSHFHAIGFAPWMTKKRLYISCYQRGLIEIPKGLDRRVKILDLQRNSITYIKSNAFLEYKQLEAILLQQNCFSANIYRINVPACSQPFIEIEPDAFGGLSNLNHLDLSDNKVISVPQNLPRSLKVFASDLTELGQLNTSHVRNLVNLQIALIGRNCIQPGITDICKRNFSINNFNFSSETLLYLDLPFDNLTVVPKWLFTRSLVGINLQGNPIHVVQSDDFNAWPQIKFLIISWTSKFNNKRMTIMNGAFDNLPELVYIDLSGNMLTAMPDFTSHKKLSSIGFDYNCLKNKTHNPTNLSSLPLTKLEMFGNTFCTDEIYPIKTRMPTFKLGNVFLNLTKLITLKFGGFTSVTMPTIQEMYWVLSYGYNYEYVTENSLKVLQKLPNLQQLSLTLSGIRSIDMSMFCKFNLTLLDLGINEINKLSVNEDVQKSLKNGTETIQNTHVHSHSHKHLIHMSQFHTKYIETLSDQNSNMLILHRNALTTLENDAFKCFSKTTYLDLSYNEINYIPSGTFAYMTQLEKLNLQFNPIRQIYPETQNGLAKLSSLKLNYTTFQGDFTLQFLLNATSEITLDYEDVTDNIYRLLSAYRMNSTTFPNVYEIAFSDIPIPIYDILNNEPIFSPFLNLQKITLINAQISTSLGNKFFQGIFNVTHVTLRSCLLRTFPYQALEVLPTLKYLDLSYNFFETLSKQWFDHLPNLTSLILSHNYIRHVDSHTFHSLVRRGLKKLDLSHNLLTDVRDQIIDGYILSSLFFLDLRKNPIACDCSLTRNFGQLIVSKTSKQLNIPGFLPVCPAPVDDYYGGCLTCTSESGSFRFQPPSLFLYSLSNICEERFLIALSVSYVIFIVVYILLTLVCISDSLKNRLMTSWFESIIGQVNDQTPKPPPHVRLYDVFVVYDTNDSVIGDWVDFTMASNLQTGFPSFKVGVVEKEDWSGLTSEVQQLLLRMEASSKTIVLLSNQFARSVKCRYVLGVLEQWVYTKGEDRCIIVTFQKHPSTAQGFQMRRRRNKWSVLNLSDLNADNAVFFELLRHAIAAKH